MLLCFTHRLKKAGMASFDFVDAAAKAYEFTWKERAYITRAAAPVIFVKLACVLMIYSLGLQEKFLLNGLVNIPGYVVEAIFIIGLIRFVLFKEPMFMWNRSIAPPDSDRPALLYSDLQSREIAIKAGIAMYLLIRIIIAAFLGSMLDLSQVIDHAGNEPPPPNIASAILVLALLWIIVWGFRLAWLYIPIAMGYSFTKFLHVIKGFNSSLSMFAAWFLCYLPIVILLAGFFNLADLIASEGSALQTGLQELLKIIGELMLTILPVITLTYGFLEILSPKKPKDKH